MALNNDYSNYSLSGAWLKEEMDSLSTTGRFPDHKLFFSYLSDLRTEISNAVISRNISDEISSNACKLLVIYKVGTCIFDTNNSVCSEIRELFSIDSELIYQLNKELLGRLNLCTYKDLDLTEADQDAVKSLLANICDYVSERNMPLSIVEKNHRAGVAPDHVTNKSGSKENKENLIVKTDNFTKITSLFESEKNKPNLDIVEQKNVGIYSLPQLTKAAMRGKLIVESIKAERKIFRNELETK